MAVPSRVADALLDELGITSSEDLQFLELIAFQRKAVVRTAYLGSAEARLTIGARRSIITISTTVTDPRRKRFGIAHEIGHLEMHRHKSSLSQCLREDMENWRFKPSDVNLEQEANEFAAALLLPRRFFADLCADHDPSMDYIVELANTFNVSLTATARRYVQFCFEPVAVVWSKKGYIRWFQGSGEFTDLDLFVDVNSLVGSATIASQFFEQGLEIPRTSRSVPASAWLRPGNYCVDLYLREHSIALPTYNAVLTLLWVESEGEDDDEIRRRTERF